MTKFLNSQSENISDTKNYYSDNPMIAISSALNKNPQKIFSELILNESIYSNSDFLDIFNFSLYYYLTSPQIQSAKLKEILENLKRYFFLNRSSIENKNTMPILYFPTIERSFTEIGNLIQSEIFFISKENLATLDDLIQFMQDICTKLCQISREITHVEFKLAEKCVKQINSIFEKLRTLNNKLNNFNREKINFVLANYKQINLNRTSLNSNSTAITRQTDVYMSSNTNYKTSSSTYQCDTKHSINISNNENQKNNIKKSSENIINTNSNEILENKILSDDLINLTAKTKNYNINHFTKELFLNKFLKSLNIKENSIYSMLSNVSLNYFSEVKKDKIDSIIEYIDFANLKAIFSNYFPGHLVYLIGSVRSSLLYDTHEHPATVDLLLLPNIYTQAQSTSKNVCDHIRVFKNLNGILAILKSINANKALSLELTKIENVNDTQLENFYLNLDLVNKRNKTRNSLNINLILYDEKVKMSSDISTFVFYKNKKLQALHVFFQEILINTIKLIRTRRDLSVLILAFLNNNYKLGNQTKERLFYNLSFKELKDGTLHSSKKVSKNFRNSELAEESYNYWYKEFNQESILQINKIELGELILEFLRYSINYFNYLKNLYNVKINKNFPHCKGYDYLKEQFHENINDPKENYNLTNHLFLTENLRLAKKDYDFLFCKKVNALEEIYFKICENPEKINNMQQIIQNINTNYSDGN